MKAKKIIKAPRELKFVVGMITFLFLPILSLNLYGDYIPEINKPSFNNSYDSFAWDLNYLCIMGFVAAPFAAAVLMVTKILDFIWSKGHKIKDWVSKTILQGAV